MRFRWPPWRPRRPKTRAEIIRGIRDHFLSLGHDTSDLTDEELEAGIVRFSEAHRQFGLSRLEAAEMVRRIGQAI